MTNGAPSANNAPRMPPRPFTNTLALFTALSIAASAADPSSRPAPGRTALDEPLVDISRACPGIIIDLRYATARNITGRPLYPAGARALLRKSVAERLNRAQQSLQDRGFGLKVWDAYRPAWVQARLWNAVRNPAYVVAPSSTGSLHGWGAAVDVTLVDFHRREVRMPTDFDAFSEAARYDYRGGDPEIAYNLATLKRAMAGAGFRHIRDEWWHYSVGNVPGYGPIDVPIAGAGTSDELADADATKISKPGALQKNKVPRPGRALFPQRADETL